MLMLLCVHMTSVLFLVLAENFADYGLLLELHTLTLVTRSYTLLHLYILLHILAYPILPLLNSCLNTCFTISQHRWVEGSNLMVCGSYIYNHYVDCRDANYYLSSDKINDSLCLPPDPDKQLSPVLACQDCSLRVLRVCNVTHHCS